MVVLTGEVSVTRIKILQTSSDTTPTNSGESSPFVVGSRTRRSRDTDLVVTYGAKGSVESAPTCTLNRKENMDPRRFGAISQVVVSAEGLVGAQALKAQTRNAPTR